MHNDRPTANISSKERVWQWLGLALTLALHLLCELLALTAPSLPHNTSATHKGLFWVPPPSFSHLFISSQCRINSRQTDRWPKLITHHISAWNPQSRFNAISHLSEPSHVPFIIAQSHLTRSSVNPERCSMSNYAEHCTVNMSETWWNQSTEMSENVWDFHLNLSVTFTQNVHTQIPIGWCCHIGSRHFEMWVQIYIRWS